VLPIPQSLLVLTAFAIVMFVLGWVVANRRTNKPAA
jgi:hypothetical protein